MAKCKRCGKKGLFLKVNYDGYCPECEEEVRKENEAKQRERKELAIKNALDRLNPIPTGDLFLELVAEKQG